MNNDTITLSLLGLIAGSMLVIAASASKIADNTTKALQAIDRIEAQTERVCDAKPRR